METLIILLLVIEGILALHSLFENLQNTLKLFLTLSLLRRLLLILQLDVLYIIPELNVSLADSYTMVSYDFIFQFVDPFLLLVVQVLHFIEEYLLVHINKYEIPLAFLLIL